MCNQATNLSSRLVVGIVHFEREIAGSIPCDLIFVFCFPFYGRWLNPLQPHFRFKFNFYLILSPLKLTIYNILYPLVFYFHPHFICPMRPQMFLSIIFSIFYPL